MTQDVRTWIAILALSTLVASLGLSSEAGAGTLVTDGRFAVGIWVDIGSIPRDSAGICKMLDGLAKMGVIDVYVEVFNRGLTIYPSAVSVAYGLPGQRDGFRDAFGGQDPLRILVDQSHLRGLRVHAWMDVLYVGFKERGHLLDMYPSWETVARDGSRGYGPPTGRQHWLSPASAGARQFLTALVDELVSRYDVDGVHFDYIRYPDPIGGDCGYEWDCVHGFTEKYGVNPLGIDVRGAERGDSRALRELALWNTWRASKVTELVSALARAIKTRRPGVLVSAAVTPAGVPDGPYPGLLQDWPGWVRSGVLDYVVPMTYTSRSEELRGLARWTALLLGQPKAPACGVQMWKRDSPDDVVCQLKILKEEGAAGAVLFAQAYLTSDVASAVRDFLVPGAPTASSASGSASASVAATAHDVAPAATGPTAEDADSLAPSLAPSLATAVLSGGEGQSSALLPTVAVPFVDPPPRVDGEPSDTAWLKATPISLCCDVMKPGRTWPKRCAQAKIVHDADGLYFAFTAFAPPVPDSPSLSDGNRVGGGNGAGAGRGGPVATRDGPVFYDDSIEIFIDPTCSGSLFYHFAFNSLGTRYDATRLGGPSWDHDWVVASRVEDGTWLSEVFIPFEAFGRSTDGCEEWRLNVCSNSPYASPDGGRFMSWAPLPGIYAAPRYFGNMRIGCGDQGTREGDTSPDEPAGE
ncbi:MAG: family 10 glycosylhydrolase [Firmicutes bacterium]|nr:family 10 glycosylhydrolase [Bacillota bacterium]MDH7496782.1 family 10 glycosylhydrolase [Bacillota bacterium]